MKAKLSDLELVQMNLLSSFVHFFPGSQEEINNFFLTDDINFDFNILNHKKNKSQFKILLLVKINDSKKPGYSIIVTMEGIFRVQNDVTDEDYQNLKLVSALPMMISSLRTNISDLTSKFSIGEYLLPSIDLTDLIKQKNEIEIKDLKKLSKKK